MTRPHLATRATLPGSTWVYPPGLRHRLRHLQGSMDALVAAHNAGHDLDGARIDAVGADIADLVDGLAAEHGRVDGLWAAMDTATHACTVDRDGLRTDLSGVREQLAAMPAAVGDTVDAAVSAEADARAAADARTAGRCDTLTARLDAVAARLDALAAAVQAVSGRRALLVGGSLLLPALLAGAAKDVEVPWDVPLPAAPVSARVAGVEGVAVLLAYSVKAVSARSVLVSVSAPVAVGAQVARLRVLGISEGSV